MNRRPLHGDPADERAATRADRVAACVFGQFRRGLAVERGDVVTIAVEPPNDREIPLAQTRPVSTIASSTGCKSFGERLMTLSTSAVAVWYSSNSCSSRGPRLLGFEQACVFDRNHRLIGEVLEHRDLAVVEGAHLGSIECDCADDATSPSTKER